MQFHVVINDIQELKTILDTVDAIIEDALFICDNKGIIFRGMDPSHIALIDIFWPNAVFDKYECKSSLFGIKVRDLKNVINTALNTDRIELQVLEPNVMKVVVNGLLKVEFNMRLMDASDGRIKVPSISYSSMVSVGSETFNKVLNNIQTISDLVTINCRPEKLQFLGRGDAGDAKIDLDKNSSELQVIRSTGDASATYNLEYLMHVMRGIGKASKTITFEYGTMNPIHLEFELPSKTKINYYLAPQMEN